MVDKRVLIDKLRNYQQGDPLALKYAEVIYLLKIIEANVRYTGKAVEL